MTRTNRVARTRAVVAALLMVCWVFAGTVGFSGAVAAQDATVNSQTELETALDKAEPGDVIEIEEQATGPYHPVVVDTAEITLQAAPGETPTIDTNDGTAPAIIIQENGVSVSGFQINGYGTADGATPRRAIEIDADDFVIEGNTIGVENEATDPTAVLIEVRGSGNTGEVRGNDFEAQQDDVSPGVLGIEFTSRADTAATHIEQNTFNVPRGIRAYDHQLRVKNNEFMGNSDQGQIVLDSGVPLIEGSISDPGTVVQKITNNDFGDTNERIRNGITIGSIFDEEPIIEPQDVGYPSGDVIINNNNFFIRDTPDSTAISVREDIRLAADDPSFDEFVVDARENFWGSDEGPTTRAGPGADDGTNLRAGNTGTEIVAGADTDGARVEGPMLIRPYLDSDGTLREKISVEQVTPENIVIDETGQAEVTATLTNTEDISIDHIVRLEVYSADGEGGGDLVTKEVSLDAGEQEEIAFTIEPTDRQLTVNQIDGGTATPPAGIYDFTIASETGSGDGSAVIEDPDTERGALTGTIRTTTGQRLPDGQAENVTLTIENDEYGTVLSEVPAKNLSAATNRGLNAGFNTDDDAYTVTVPVFNDPDDYTVTADLRGFEDFSGTTSVFAGETSTQDIRLESNIVAAELGVAAYDPVEQEVIGDSSALLANGSPTNNATFIVFAQSQTGGALPTGDVTVTAAHDRADFVGTNGIFEIDEGGERTNTSTAQTLELNATNTLPADAVAAAYEDTARFEEQLIDPDGSVSIAAFTITADAVDEDLLATTSGNGGSIESEFLENFEIEATTDTDSGADRVDDDFDTVGDSDKVVGNEITATADALYFLEGDKSVTGDIRDQAGEDVPSDVEVWAVYDAVPDKSLPAVQDLQNADGESFLTTTVTESGNYQITGLAGEGTAFTVYARTPQGNFNSIPADANGVDSSITTSLAAAEDLQTRNDPARTTTQDLILQQEVQEYEIDLTAEDFGSGELVKNAEVPTGGSTTVQAQVGSRTLGDEAADFTPIQGVDVELTLTDEEANSELLSQTVTTDADGIATTEFEATTVDPETTNVSATVTNADGDAYITADGEGAGENTDANQTLIEVFGAGEITGDVVNEADENILNADVQLEQRNATSGEFEVVRERRVATGDLGSFAFVNVRSNDVDEDPYRVTAFAVDENGEEITGQSRELQVDDGTVNADVVVVDAVPDPGDQPGDGTDLARFDTSGDGEIDFPEVLDAIEANNEGTEIGGEPVDFDNVLDVITANNEETAVVA